MTADAFTLPEEDLRRIVAESGADLSAMRGGRIVLTGCTGFFGKWLVETLLHADRELGLGLRLGVLTRNAAGFYAEMPHLRQFRNLGTINRSIQEITSGDFSGPVTHIIHGANLLNDGSADWALRHMQTAVEGTRRLLSAAGKHGGAAVLLLSSGAVYASGLARNVVPFREEAACAEDYLSEPGVYAACKYFLEMFCAAYGRAAGLRIPTARCFTFFGPYMPLHARQALSSFFNDILHDRTVTVTGDGTAVRSYMYAADLIIRLLAILVRGRHGTPYNVGSELPVSVKDLAHCIAAVSGNNPEIIIQGKDVRGNAPAIYLPDASRVKSELGVCGEVNFEEALRRTFRWYMSSATSRRG
ncbi:MAG: NAD(P)-dependent oxidoreductase [Desulfovibrio sp.]|jgi:dTDP-glucose 4,6-dehydratase|nr:NAD(P)-dependent oxidoreductase [Desulfovibrio sp.]